MIIKVDTNNHRIVHATPETYTLKYATDGFVQVIENGVPQFVPGDIRTYILGPNISRDYEDPRMPERNIHNIQIEFSGEECTIIDNGDTIILHKIDTMYDYE